jgi:hypothetical protein
MVRLVLGHQVLPELPGFLEQPVLPEHQVSGRQEQLERQEQLALLAQRGQLDLPELEFPELPVR